MISNYVHLEIMYSPSRRQWEAWDSAVMPRVYGFGQTPGEAVNDLTGELQKLAVYAPSWILAQENNKHA